MAPPSWLNAEALLLCVAVIRSVAGASSSGWLNHHSKHLPQMLPRDTAPEIVLANTAPDDWNAHTQPEKVSADDVAANSVEPRHPGEVLQSFLWGSKEVSGVGRAPAHSLGHPTEGRSFVSPSQGPHMENQTWSFTASERNLKQSEPVEPPRTPEGHKEAPERGTKDDAARKQLARVSQLKQVQDIMRRIEQYSQQDQDKNPRAAAPGLEREQDADVPFRYGSGGANNDQPLEELVPENQSDQSSMYHIPFGWSDDASGSFENSTQSASQGMPFVLPLYSSSFTAELPYANVSQTMPSPTESPELPALTEYYTQLGDIKPVFFLLGNLTPPLNDTIGVNTITEFFQEVLDQETRDRIVAMTPPRVFGRAGELFWGTLDRAWRQWVDIWRNYKRSPPYALGVKRQEADGYQRIYNEFASWAYDLPFYLYDTLFNNTVFYLYPVLIARSEAIARRDQVLLRSMEKQAIFYAPIFYSSRTVLQHIEYLKHQVFTRLDETIEPSTVVVQTANQALTNAKNAADVGYGLLQVCALNPQCCRLPSRCFPIEQDNVFKRLNLKIGLANT